MIHRGSEHAKRTIHEIDISQHPTVCESHQPKGALNSSETVAYTGGPMWDGCARGTVSMA